MCTREELSSLSLHAGAARARSLKPFLRLDTKIYHLPMFCQRSSFAAPPTSFYISRNLCCKRSGPLHGPFAFPFLHLAEQPNVFFLCQNAAASTHSAPRAARGARTGLLRLRRGHELLRLRRHQQSLLLELVWLDSVGLDLRRRRLLPAICWKLL